MKLNFVIIFFLTLASKFFSQENVSYYVPDKFLFDTTCFYYNGEKIKNQSNRNKSIDGFEYNSDFYLAKFNLKGKKEWELIFDKNRSCREIFPIHKCGNLFYTFFSIMNRNIETSVFYLQHFLICFDSAGKVHKEFKLKDSTFYGINKIIYAKDHIYIFPFKDKSLICEKYDYDFNLLEKIKNDALVVAFFKSNVFSNNNEFVSFGPIDDIENINKTISTKSIMFYRPSIYGIKKTSLNLSVKSSCKFNQLPLGEKVDFSTYDHGLFYVCSEFYKNPDAHPIYKLYEYNSKLNSIKLLRDTMQNSIVFLKNLGKAADYFYITAPKTVFDGKANTRKDYPAVIISIKNNKIVSKQAITKDDIGYSSTKYFFIGNKLSIFQAETEKNSRARIITYDYKDGFLLNRNEINECERSERS